MIAWGLLSIELSQHCYPFFASYTSFFHKLRDEQTFASLKHKLTEKSTFALTKRQQTGIIK
jgi:hypothetical protein